MKDHIINQLVQLRTLEANKKNINNKLMCIARNYGSPIMGHYYDAPLVDEDWGDFNNPNVKWYEDENEDGTIPKLGFIYDSLKIGVNFEIVLMARETRDAITGKKELEKPTELRCSYNGQMVYQEKEGVLTCYVPNQQWEKHLDGIFKYAIRSEKDRNTKDNKETIKRRQKSTHYALSNLKKLWGI